MFQRRDGLRSVLRGEDCRRMGKERDHSAFLVRSGIGAHPCQKLTMPSMDSIKVANRDPASLSFRQKIATDFVYTSISPHRWSA